MRAVVQSAYGTPSRVLSVADVPEPQPAADEVVLAVTAASVHPDVWHVVTGRPLVLRVMGPGMVRPRAVVPGTDATGTVTAVGSDVTRFLPGDVVFGETLRGLQWNNGGTWAELVTAPTAALVHVPAGVDPIAAATVSTAGLIALENLQSVAHLGAGHRALVNGAAGGVGSIALQILRARGLHVTAVDHTERLNLLARLGADATIDYTTTDASAAGGPYDLVFDIPGNHGLPTWQRVLAPDGTYILIAHDQYGREGRRVLGSIPRMVGLMARSLRSPHVQRPTTERFDRGAAMQTLADHLATGELTPVIGRRYALEDAATALEDLASSRHVGRLVVCPTDA